MPVLLIPDNFADQLEQTESRKKRSTDGPVGTGVAVYQTPDGDRAIVYISFAFFTAELPDMEHDFSVPPNISCSSDLVFDSDKDELISIKVSRC